MKKFSEILLSADLFKARYSSYGDYTFNMYRESNIFYKVFVCKKTRTFASITFRVNSDTNIDMFIEPAMLFSPILTDLFSFSMRKEPYYHFTSWLEIDNQMLYFINFLKDCSDHI